MLSRDDKGYLLGIARKTLENVFSNQNFESSHKNLSYENGGLFVTLTKKGRLRGCIGFVQHVEDLSIGVSQSVKCAAFEDPRFPPLTEEELDDLRIEISILTKPSLLKPEDVVVGKHGLIIEFKGRSGLLLPQVANEYNMSKEEFLNAVCDKAGLPRDMWGKEGVKLYGFEAYVFSE